MPHGIPASTPGTAASRALLYWLPLAIVTSVVCALVYVAVQQDLRGTANNPQIQMAEDASAQLEADKSPTAVTGTNMVDIAQSLAPYLIIYDDAGQVLASSATLGGQVPVLPPGVLETARRQGEYRVTWQPQPGVRSATVVKRIEGTGRDLFSRGARFAKSKRASSQLTSEVLFAWLAALASGLAAMYAAVWVRDRLPLTLTPTQNNPQPLVTGHCFLKAPSV